MSSEAVHDVLLKKRIIYLNNRVDDKEVLRISEDIIMLNAQDITPITLYLTSGGGGTEAGLAIYDVMRHSLAQVIGVVQQKAHSAASIILQGCHVRKALKHAQIIVHNGSIVMDKEVDDFETNAEEEIRRVVETIGKRREFMYAIYASRTGKGIEEIKILCRDKKILSADEAKVIGLIDEVI